MKKRWQIFWYLLLYMLIFSFAQRFDIRRLIDFKNIAVLLTGTALLAFPFCRFQNGRQWFRRFSVLCGKRAIDAGVIQTFLLLFIRLSEEKAYEGLLADVALCFRPMLYAFCVKLIFDREEADSGIDESDALMKTDALAQKELTFEDCMAAGLTRREAEIALLVCKGCSNGEIAEELVISQATVKKHMSNIFEKTDIKKREELEDYIMLQQHARS